MPGSPPDLLPPCGMRHALLAAAFAAARLLPKGRSTFASLAHRLLGCPRRIVADLGGQRFAVDMRDRHTALAAALAGIYEPAATAVFLKLLRPGARVLDIGANKGYFSLLAAARIGDAGTVISYEPLAENAADIEATRDLGAFANWQVVRAAVSDAPGEVAFADSGWAQGHSGWGCVRADGALRVPAVTLEGELARLGWAAADVVKLDIEGHEYPLLAAAEPLFARGAVGALLAEFHTSVPGAADGLPAAAAMLARCGYHLWRVADPREPISDLAAAESLNLGSLLESFDPADPRPVDLRVHVLCAKALPGE